ncbi:DUF1641 domain-containing protein [Neobacillus cucumis]|uniref:DUF1641 domain-containing protein n=1 Tax=Neobacillus cucumis TaxID=1740721 RepID=UPI0028536412|nr:DUF1641 domain-containing protein [Neobacillus cucumis]MDR4947163.1 DUF1641 domain-containing protein [Neobacillus cucumis]
MAKPIKVIQKTELTEEQKKKQSLENLLSGVAENKESLLETLMLLQELHESGITEALGSLLKTKEKAAKIAVGQLTRKPVTNMINNAMAAGGILTELDPETTSKLAKSLTSGLQRAEQGLKEDYKIGLFDLMKAIKDPDINRALGFGFNLLKGMGEGLKE